MFRLQLLGVSSSRLRLSASSIAVEQPTSVAPTQGNGTIGWELALVTAPSSNESATAAGKLAGGLDKLTLDSLYDDALRRNNQNVSYNHWEPQPMAGPMMQPNGYVPFYASGMVGVPQSVQMAAIANQPQALMLQQQQQQQQMMMMAQQQQQQMMMMAAQQQQQQMMMMTPQQQQQMMMMAPQQTSNPFANPYVANVHLYGSGMPVQAHNPYTGLR